MSLHQKDPITQVFDLVVVGGGLAGLCAAIGAAREGAKVALIHERPVFGGNSSSEIRVVPHGANHSNAWAGHTGLVLELLLSDRAGNHEMLFDHGMTNSHFDLTLLEAARRESNLTFFLNTVMRAVDSVPLSDRPSPPPQPTSNGLGRLGGEGRHIKAVHAFQLGAEKELRFEARQFIDATGDGTLGYLAGADFRYGREARHEFNEALAPIEADEVTLGATITMRARDIGRPVPYTAPDWIERYEKLEDIGLRRTLYHLDRPVYGGYWWLEVNNPFHQIDDNAEVRAELHRHVLGVWNFIKNHSDHRQKASTYVLDWIGMIPGKRESRRLMGDVVFTENDCHEDRRWPDAIGFAGWWIDLHIKGGILNKTDPGERENVDRNYKHWIRVPVVTVPLRAHYSRNVENLWMAGRIFSATHVAIGPVRVMQTLAQIGQAVGIAAARAIAANALPRAFADAQGPHLKPYRQRLLRADLQMPGLTNEDPDDLARSATVTATSEATLDLGTPAEGVWFNMHPVPVPGKLTAPSLAMVVPLTEPRLETIEVYLRSMADRDQQLDVIVERLDRIWDRPDNALVVAKGSLPVPAGAEGWHEIRLDTDIEPNHPYRIVLAGGSDIAWAGSTTWPVGTTGHYLHVSPGGPETRNAHLGGFAEQEVHIPAYRHWRQLLAGLAMRLTPDQYPFAPKNVANGVPAPERLPNIWISDPQQALPQHLELRFPERRRVSRVVFSFDTNLGHRIQCAPAFFRAPECVRDLVVEAETLQGWQEVARMTDNFQRHRTITFDPIETTALRVIVQATNGAPEARLYETRVYG